MGAVTRRVTCTWWVLGLAVKVPLLAKAGSGLKFSFRVRAWTEMEILCVKGMLRLKLVSSGNKG